MLSEDPPEIEKRNCGRIGSTATKTPPKKTHLSTRLLEHHWKSHHKEMPKIRFINNETGESVDAQGNYYPTAARCKPIIPASASQPAGTETTKDHYDEKHAKAQSPCLSSAFQEKPCNASAACAIQTLGRPRVFFRAPDRIKIKLKKERTRGFRYCPSR